MNKFKKIICFSLGVFCLGIAYLGTIIPGLPWTTPAFVAMLCFAKSSDRWHNWIMNHKLFGPFLKRWQDKKVYPTKIKWIMFISMVISLGILIVTTQNWKLCLAVGMFMLLGLIFALRYPGSEDEYERRKRLGLRIGWLK